MLAQDIQEIGTREPEAIVQSHQIVDLCCTNCVDEAHGGLDEEHDDHEVRHNGDVEITCEK